MKHLIMGTAGHIDHGKTSLIKTLTDVDCDTHEEEKRRGITINLGFSALNLPGGESLGIIDVPGHKDFINTMVGGACGIDLVLLVIAADSGIMPQTVEHINIVTALGISKGVVALTKTDLVDDELIEMARYEISDFLENTSLKDAPVVGISCLTGKGKQELIQAIESVVSQINPKKPEGIFRMYIDRIFTVKGFGNVVTGSVLGGSIETGKDVFLLPGENKKLRIRSMERHGVPVEKVVAGDRAAINLIGLKNEDFERGMLISEKQLRTTSMVDAKISLFNDDISLNLWSNVIFISGTFECTARVHLLNKEICKGGEEAIVQMHLYKDALLLNKDRFIIRNSSGDTTLGGGFVIDSNPLHHKKRTPELIETLTQLAAGTSGEDSIVEIITTELKKEFRPYTVDEIAEKLHLKIEHMPADTDLEASRFCIYRSAEGDILINSAYEKVFKNKVVKILQEYHSKFPVFPHGLETNDISGKLGLSKMKSGKPYLNFLLAKMKSEKLIDTFRNTWIIAGHKAMLDKQTKEEIQWLENEILRYDTGKPVLSEIEELAASKNITKQKIKMYLSNLAGEGKLRFFQNDFIHTSLLDRFRLQLLKELSSKESGLEIEEFKEILGGSKRFRALLADIYEAEKIIKVQRGADVETRIMITPTGKNLLHESLP